MRPVPFLALILGLSLATSALAEDGPSTAPRSSEEAFARLGTILGSFKPKDSRQFRMHIDSEEKDQPELDKPPVLIVSKGDIIFGNPYRLGGAVAFDVVESIKRVVYELGPDNQRKIIRRQQRYMANRYTLHLDETGNWEFQSTFLTHSIPDNIGRTYLKGSVKWLPDAVVLFGIATDNSYAAGGDLIHVAEYARIKLARVKDDLVISDQWQSYHLVTGPDQTSVPIPNFDKPIGKPSQWLSGKAIAGD